MTIINDYGMKKVLTLFFLVNICLVTANAQKVFSTDHANLADVKVFVVQHENLADLKVYKVKHNNLAGENNGVWFFTDHFLKIQ